MGQNDTIGKIELNPSFVLSIACYISRTSIASNIYMPISLQQPPSEYSTQSQINKRENKVRKPHKVCIVTWERYHFKLRGQEKVPFSHRQFE